jgi:hypothetical protein
MLTVGGRRVVGADRFAPFPAIAETSSHCGAVVRAVGFVVATE